MPSRVRSALGARVKLFAVRWSDLSGAAQERSTLRSDVQHLGARLDALEAAITDLWRRGELAADNRALGLQDLALRLQAESAERAGEHHQRALEAAERSADALVVNLRRAIEAEARELHAVAAELRAASQALQVDRNGTGG